MKSEGQESCRCDSEAQGFGLWTWVSALEDSR